MTYDRNGGSQGAVAYKKNPIKLYFARKYMTDYKNLNFGHNTRWEDIDCMEFFDLQPIQPERFGGFMDGEDRNYNNITSIQYYSSPVLSNQNIGAFMGHDVCSVDVLPEFNRQLFPLYYDAPSWAPEDFKAAIGLEMEFIHNETTREDWIWNEFVFSLPHELPPLVQGVFHVNDNYTGKLAKRREAAQRQAKAFGDLPVFILHNEENWNGDVLDCGDHHNTDYSENDKSSSLDHKEVDGIIRIQSHLIGKRRYERQPFEKMHLSSAN